MGTADDKYGDRIFRWRMAGLCPTDADAPGFDATMPALQRRKSASGSRSLSCIADRLESDGGLPSNLHRIPRTGLHFGPPCSKAFRCPVDVDTGSPRPNGATRNGRRSGTSRYGSARTSTGRLAQGGRPTRDGRSSADRTAGGRIGLLRPMLGPSCRAIAWRGPSFPSNSARMVVYLASALGEQPAVEASGGGPGPPRSPTAASMQVPAERFTSGSGGRSSK